MIESKDVISLIEKKLSLIKQKEELEKQIHEMKYKFMDLNISSTLDVDELNYLKEKITNYKILSDKEVRLNKPISRLKKFKSAWRILEIDGGYGIADDFNFRLRYDDKGNATLRKYDTIEEAKFQLFLIQCSENYYKEHIYNKKYLFNKDYSFNEEEIIE